MGSSGSGSFTDYSDYKSSLKQGGGNNGGTSGEDLCARAFSTSLDEVANCEFYQTGRNVPESGTPVNVVFDKRMIVQNDDGVSLGLLPTRFNYLRSCMTDGFTYSGVIVNSSLTPIPTIIVDIAPNHE